MNRYWLILPVLCGALIQTGCGIWPVFDRSGSSSAAGSDGAFLGISANRSRVAADLVGALGQIDGLQPESAVLQMAPPEESFGVSLASALTDAGYQLNQSDDVADNGQVIYEVKNNTDDEGGTTVIIGVDKVKLKRDYKTTDGTIRPVSSLFVLGADPEDILLDNKIFEGGDASGSESNLTSTEALASMPIDSVISGLSLKRKLNINEIGDSNFAEVLNQYQDIDTRVLVFGNDSMRLGASNKWYMKAMAERFDATTDAFSVIGCSSGKTSITNGNAVLALGRAQRVKEELLVNGVPDANILDEGCWSSTRWDFDLPPRGVVVTLKRRGSAVW